MRNASDQELQARYSVAIQRLVNGVNDSLARGLRRSILSTSRDVDLPEILVDIRHYVSHRTIPTISTLREGAAKALKWLCENYWEKQSDHVKFCWKKISQKLTEFVEHLLLKYQQQDGLIETITEDDEDTYEQSPSSGQDDDKCDSLSSKSQSSNQPQNDIPLQNQTVAMKKWFNKYDLMRRVSVIAFTLLRNNLMNPDDNNFSVSQIWQRAFSYLVRTFPGVQMSIYMYALQNVYGITSIDQIKEINQGLGARAFSQGRTLSLMYNFEWMSDEDTKDGIRGKELDRKVALSWLKCLIQLSHAFQFEEYSLKKYYQQVEQRINYHIIFDSIFLGFLSGEQLWPEKLEALEILINQFSIKHQQKGQQLNKILQALKVTQQLSYQDQSKLQYQLNNLLHSHNNKRKCDEMETQIEQPQKRQKWEKCKSWIPCAIGNTPSCFVGNGLPPLIQHNEQQLQQQQQQQQQIEQNQMQFYDISNSHQLQGEIGQNGNDTMKSDEKQQFWFQDEEIVLSDEEEFDWENQSLYIQNAQINVTQISTW
eukprot:TRINITY_DN2803_c0_g1_i14.p1 TRINITY_DN2803_c0_g1~~TRINITY_DN2803_c0_g1_i14.p1  ORF type:complete len:619 (-),score=53.49 TRINITY_DN2803_c0_g1_i14:306-1919(-)